MRLFAVLTIFLFLAAPATAGDRLSPAPDARLRQLVQYGGGGRGGDFRLDPYWYQHRRLERPWEKVYPDRPRPRPQPTCYWVDTDFGPRRICQ